MKQNKHIAAQLFAAQFIGVFVWFLITVVQWSNNPKASPGISIPLIVRGVEAIAVLIISGGMIFVINKIRVLFKPFIARLLLLALIYLLAIAANLISLALRGMLGYAPPKIDGYFFIQSLHFYIPLLLVFVIYYLVRNRFELQSEREDKLRAEGLAQQAKWMMLRYQVNPHFLFNALNSIRALIGHNDEKAREIVTKMSEYFRYSLSVEKRSLVTVKEEMNAVENYLAIQIIRFPDRLKVIQKIDEGAMDCLVPVFTIQTLIENAIKYGMKTHEGVVEIAIIISREKGKLKIHISNSGRLVAPDDRGMREDGTNTGIENLKKRLFFMDNSYQFQLTEDNGQVHASVMLNYCKSNEDLEDYNH